MSRKPIVFVHVPKTAGTSLMEAIAANFPQPSVVRLVDVEKPFTDVSQDIERALDRGAQFVVGHFPLASIEPFLDQVSVVSVLRHPVERVLSLFRFWSTTSGQASPAAQFRCDIARTSDLDTFVESRHPIVTRETQNGMCRMLARRLASGDERESVELLQSAIEAVEQVTCGVTENLAAFAAEISAEFELALPEIRVINQTTTGMRPEPTQATTRIAELNALDLELYRTVRLGIEHRLQRRQLLRAFAAARDRQVSFASDDNELEWHVSDPMVGTGWYEREESGGRQYRFTTSPCSSIMISGPSRAGTFELKLLALFSGHGHEITDPWRATTVRVNETVRGIIARELDGGGMELVVPDLQLEAKTPVALEILSDLGVSPSLRGSPDRRVLGIAIERISLRRK